MDKNVEEWRRKGSPDPKRSLAAVEDQGLGLDYADRYKERIGRVTAKEIQSVAAKYFPPDSFSLVTVGEIK